MVKRVVYLFVTIIVVIVIFSPLIIKVKIECKSQIGDCPINVSAKLESLDNKSLFFARRGAIKILDNNFLTLDYSMQLNLPNILLINLIIKRPQYAVYDKSKNKYLLVDNIGTITTFSDSSDLPTLIKDLANGNEGDIISNNDLFALKLISGINQMYQVNTGLTQNDTLVVDLAGGVRVILPLADNDPEVLLGSLRLIYTKLSTDNSMGYSQIDMRFKNPVIR